MLYRKTFLFVIYVLLVTLWMFSCRPSVESLGPKFPNYVSFYTDIHILKMNNFYAPYGFYFQYLDGGLNYEPYSTVYFSPHTNPNFYPYFDTLAKKYGDTSYYQRRGVNTGGTIADSIKRIDVIAYNNFNQVLLKGDTLNSIVNILFFDPRKFISSGYNWNLYPSDSQYRTISLINFNKNAEWWNICPLYLRFIEQPENSYTDSFLVVWTKTSGLPLVDTVAYTPSTKAIQENGRN